MNRYRKVSLFLSLGSISAALIYLLFFYTPYSDKQITENWRLAKKCDSEALSYLADYYEKRDDQSKFQEVIEIGAKCGKNWAIDLLKYMHPKSY